MKALKLATPILVVFAGLSFSSSVAAQRPSIDANGKKGSICVLPNSPEPPTRISPGGEYNPDTLTLRVDRQESLHWPHKRAATALVRVCNVVCPFLIVSD